MEGLKNQMKAEKMFEKLGYASHENGSGSTIVYSTRYCFIEFTLKYKEVFVYAQDDEGEKENCSITMDELEAIIQQCRELGWL